MKGLKEVFVFSLRQQLNIPSVKILTVVMALLFFFVPVVSMTLTELNRSGEAETGEEFFGGEYAFSDGEFEQDFSDSDYSAEGISGVLYVNGTAGSLGYDFLENAEVPGLEGVGFTPAGSVAAANEAAQGKDGTLILSLCEKNGSLEVVGVLPDGTALSYDKAQYAADRVLDALPTLVATGKGLPAEAASEIEKPFFMDYRGPEDDGEMSEEDMRNEALHEIAVMILPYVNIMLIYFLVLYYGQSAANSVILEKTSKLMDTFLVAVKPESMIFGKVLAEWIAALIQFLSWVVSLVGGFAVGTLIVKQINPDSTMGILRLFSYLGNVTKTFALPEVIVAVLIIAAGFFLYCCLAAICASFASKPEELAATISIFSILLVVSMFVTLRAGFLNGEMAKGVKWFDFFPFTAILITPSRLLLGYVSFGAGLGSLAVIVLLSLVCIRIAGRVYRMMSLYRGKVPKLPQIIAMFKEG